MKLRTRDVIMLVIGFGTGAVASLFLVAVVVA
jgi:hypothetical protein